MYWITRDLKIIDESPLRDYTTTELRNELYNRGYDVKNRNAKTSLSKYKLRIELQHEVYIRHLKGESLVKIAKELNVDFYELREFVWEWDIL